MPGSEADSTIETLRNLSISPTRNSQVENPRGHLAQDVLLRDQASLTIGDTHEYNVTVNQTTHESKAPSTVDILKWLPSINFRTLYEDRLKNLHIPIGKRSLESEEFASWYNGENKWLWCHGMPGAGKTSLVTLILQYLLEVREKQKRNIGVAYLYCIHWDKSQSAISLVGTILQQLAQQSTEISNELKSLYQKHTSVLPQSSPLLEEYEKALESQLGHFESVYLIVDALDECRSDDAADFQLDTKSRLLQALGYLGDKIHLLVTSRDENLRTVGLGMEVPFKVMKVTATDGDITAYVEGRIASSTPFRELTGRYPRLKNEVKETIVAKAAGMFLPAKLYMDFLAREAATSRKSHVLRALRKLPSFHDKTFEEAYRDAYTGILKGIWEQSAYDVELARKVLSWVVFTKDPQNLTIDIVKQALLLEDKIDEAGTDTDITDDEYDEIPEEKLLSVCRGLLTVDHHGKTLRFVHYTAEIYFSKPAVQNEDFPNAQEQIAQTCLSCILSNTPRGAGYYALDRYASLHWGHHAQTVEELVQPEIQRLFEDEERMRKSFQGVVAPLPRDWRRKGQAVNSGIKPLHVAAYFGLRLIATMLLERSEDIGAKDFRGWDPMRWAIFGESDALVALLFDHKANLLSEDYDGLQTMFWAVGSRETKQIVSNIFMNGDARLSLGEISTVRSGQSFATALPSPVLPKTSQSIIKFLLSNLPEVDLDIRSPVDGQTLLSVVAGNWQWDAVKILLERGANVNSRDNNGMTPLLWSLQCPRSRTVINNVFVSDDSWLSIGGIMNVESSAKISIDDSNYSEETVEPNICLLIGEHLEVTDEEQRTALSLCAENRFHKVAATLLEMGANPNTADVDGMTPLHWACSLPRLQSVVVKNLVCKDYAKVRLGTSKLPRLPLAESRRLSGHNMDRTLKSLLRYEADALATNTLGQTPLALAISDGLDNHAKILLRYQSSACDGKVEDSSHRQSIHVYGHTSAPELSERDDCERLLVAMLDRRGQFNLLNVVTMDNSSLFIYSTSNITNLSAGDTSRVLITDKPNITNLIAFHSSRVVIRAAANITSIIVNTHSRVCIETNANINALTLTDSCTVNVKGQAVITSIVSQDHARLTVGSKARIAQIRVEGASGLYTQGQCDISKIMTTDHAHIKIGADTNVAEMFIDRFSRVHAKGHCAISMILVSDHAHVKIGADTKIVEILIDRYSQVYAKGQATILKILGRGHSTLTLQAGAKIGDIRTREHSIVRMAGQSQVSRMSGFDWSRILLLAQAYIEDIGTNDHCLVLTKGRSEIHRVTSHDYSVLAVLESYQNQPLEVEARDHARLLFCEEDGGWSEGNFSTWDQAKLTILKFNPASTSEIINSLKNALGLDEEQLNIPEEVAQESEDEISDDELDDLGDDESSDEDWSWAADITSTSNSR